jgi:glyoxylase-like metal-dependent hydrolase (beta-lactamase superfamily II)
MVRAASLTRRTFLARVARVSGGLVVVGIAGCMPGAATSAPGSPTRPSATPLPDPTRPSDSPPPSSGQATPSAAGDGVAWTRVDLGFVSAYVLVRAGEAAVVDTGGAGADDEIADALASIGLDWGAVGHVILTHRHSDHIGSVSAVLEAAPDATGYAGAADLASIDAPRELRAVTDGDTVFGLQIVATPGHTAGHVSVLDPVGGILVAGDALNTSGGKVTGPNPGYTEDMATASDSVARLAALSFETLLVGHGDPIEGGASAMVAALAAGG